MFLALVINGVEHLRRLNMTNEDFTKVRIALDTDDYDYLKVIEDIIDRIDDLNDEEWVYSAINDSLIYYKDQWTVLQHFFVPQDANWNLAVELLIDDLYVAVETLRKEQK